MALKDLRIIKAEELPENIRRENGLPDIGRIAIETTNDELKVSFKYIKGGIRDYLLSFGNFKDADIDNS